MMNESGNDFDQTLLSVAEARQRLGGISKWTFYRLKREGKIQTVKIGSRTFVAASAIEKYVRRLQLESGG